MGEKYIKREIENALTWYAANFREHLAELEAAGKKETFDYAVDKGITEDLDKVREMVADGRITITVAESVAGDD